MPMTMTKRQGWYIGRGLMLLSVGVTILFLYMIFASIANAGGLSIGPKATATSGSASKAAAIAIAKQTTIVGVKTNVRAEGGDARAVGLQAQKQAVDSHDSFTIDSRPSGPSIAIGLAGLPSFSNSGIRNACGGLEAWTGSIGGSVGLSGGQISGSGGLLGFGDSTMNALILCEIRESVAQLGDANVPLAATAAACLHPVMAFGLEYAKPGTCAGITAVSEIATDDLTIAKVTNPNVYKTAPVAYVAPAPAPKPTGNATNGRCTYGFDAARGQCAKVQAFADIGRSDS